MKIIDFSCKNFRNIEDAHIVPDKYMNVICGENAQGKTNLTEGIWLFTGSKSFRGSKDTEFVKFGENGAVLSINFISRETEKDAQIKITEKREAELCGKKLKSPSLLAGNFNAVVFSPADLSLVKDGPAVRRKFLDTAIGQLFPAYIGFLRNYLRAVTQRNKVIRDLKFESSLASMLDVFEAEIAQNGKKIISFRKRYIERINEFLPDLYGGLSSGKEMLITEYSPAANAESLAEELKKKRREDMITGTTSSGPHRDDLIFTINGINARSFGSQGQKRSVAIAVKLASAEVIKSISGEYPVFLLDDVMSELDPSRQNYILNRISGLQAFLTCCDPANIKNLEAGKIFSVKNGSVES